MCQHRPAQTQRWRCTEELMEQTRGLSGGTATGAVSTGRAALPAARIVTADIMCKAIAPSSPQMSACPLSSRFPPTLGDARNVFLDSKESILTR
uniref:Uncharacterized protein n=1 Tax=Oryza glaberrima TaxID=4538 RepID=I1R5G5_ORYGL